MTGRGEIWVWSVELIPTGTATPDITGYEVAATDGDIGKVEEMVRGDDGRSYVVVDTGWWIFEKKRLIPAGAITAIDDENRRVSVRLTKDEIKHAPDYEAARRDDDEVRENHEDYYSPYAPSRR
jgi:ribosomal 30S subunit maturation factor RimM